MITQKQKIALDQYKPTNWRELVVVRLNKLGIVNSKNNEHSKEMISMVYSGSRQNKDIEAAIIYVFLSEKKRQQKIDRQLGINTPQTA